MLLLHRQKSQDAAHRFIYYDLVFVHPSKLSYSALNTSYKKQDYENTSWMERSIDTGNRPQKHCSRDMA